MERLETVSSEFFMYFCSNIGNAMHRNYETGDIDLDWISKQNQLMTIVKNGHDARFDHLMEVMRNQIDCHSTFLQLMIEYKTFEQ